MEPSNTAGHSPSEPTPIAPPTTLRSRLGHLGPGLIIAGSIVGSGELIATTKTGAEAGFSLLWLIILGCVIKVFTQVEFGRYAIITGKTALDGMNELPGPRLKRVNWLVLFWIVMFVFGIAGLGGIIGGVGQAMAINVPLGGDFKQLLAEQRQWDSEAEPIRKKLFLVHDESLKSKNYDTRQQAVDLVNDEIVKKVGRLRPEQTAGSMSDDMIWATIIALATSIILLIGRYSFIESFSIIMVGMFTVLTIVNLILLQTHDHWAIHFDEIKQGLCLGLPQPLLGKMYSPLTTALATFGMIGVGAAELVMYPYWCLEKGYATYIGRREETQAWAERARGWLIVLRLDAFCSLVLYTVSTIAFYLLGASVLNRDGLNPGDEQLIYVLGEMYRPVFNQFASMLFLFGAFAVLYSTFFVANAGSALIVTDALRILGIIPDSTAAKKRWTRILSGAFPLVCLAVAFFVRAPVMLVLAAGVMELIMLPMLCAAALYFRYYRCDHRIKPGRTWTSLLWLSLIGCAIAGFWAAMCEVFPAMRLWG